MSAPYRESAGVDETAVQCAKIHEDGETDRKLIEQREETKRQRIATVGFAPHIASVLIAALVLIPSAIVVYGYIEARNRLGSCVEASYAKGTYASAQCNHPLHVLVETETSRTCKCGAPKLP